jgi:hypothetical protein
MASADGVMEHPLLQALSLRGRRTQFGALGSTVQIQPEVTVKKVSGGGGAGGEGGGEGGEGGGGGGDGGPGQNTQPSPWVSPLTQFHTIECSKHPPLENKGKPQQYCPGAHVCPKQLEQVSGGVDGGGGGRDMPTTLGILLKLIRTMSQKFTRPPG